MQYPNSLRALGPLLATLALSCTATKEAVSPPAAARIAPFATAVGLGMADVNSRAHDLVDAVQALATAVQNRDIDGAKRAYVVARAPYEEIEVLRADFRDLHLRIDGRPADFALGEVDPEFRGFHAVELALFGREDLNAATPLVRSLVADTLKLADILNAPTEHDAATIFRTMIERTGEVASKSITSEEETWSDATLTVIRHNWMGVHTMYRHFAGALRAKDGIVAEQLDRSYRRALEVIARDFPVGEVQGTPFGIVDRAKRRRIADASLTFQARLIEAARTLGLDTIDA